MTWLAFRPAAFAWASADLTCRPGLRLYSATAGASVSDPLRILFCGSDDFSCAALDAINAEKKRNPGLIESLDVVVRPGKLSGRGMKKIREVPLKNLAEKLKLPIHERDTFTGWQPHNDINLIVAVSFGLFVPPRLLNLAKYGGLNVHPSLLPDFRGPAPLQHTLLQRRTHTGITLQTLHHKSFDHGTVLSQTPLPGIPVPENCTTQRLHDIVTPLAAEVLVEGLRKGLHVPPLKDVGWQPNEEERQQLNHAPKVTNHDRQINWSKWTADDVVLRQRVLGPVWCSAYHHDSQKIMRLKFGDTEVVERPDRINQYYRRRSLRKKGELAVEDIPGEDQDVKFVSWIWQPEGKTQDRGSWVAHRTPFFEDEDGKSILIPSAGSSCLKLSTITVEGSRSKPAVTAISGFGKAVRDKDDDNSRPGGMGDDWVSSIAGGLALAVFDI
ncbi:formyl transferase [Colletotrichum incanum]|uniref:Formyl transferase n=1 Tax=Colletotrichum incanum TaxID=1573173 RepID=A0A161WKP3_COLIC|nr:formyl transferase [Colletotrichum incanum]OHW91048.1 methionyl-tRNA formyltransferase [Colletotrichum incanum]